MNINYTYEMKAQDMLWETEEENLEIMGSLFLKIMNEAQNKGFEGSYVIYDGTNEKCIDVHEKADQANTGEPDGSFGYCKPLIQFLTTIIQD